MIVQFSFSYSLPLFEHSCAVVYNSKTLYQTRLYYLEEIENGSPQKEMRIDKSLRLDASAVFLWQLTFYDVHYFSPAPVSSKK